MKRIFKKIYSALLSPFDRHRHDAKTARQVPNDDFFPDVVAILDEGKQVTIPVKGFSMLPFIRGIRDLVVLEKRETYVPYDIVLFHCGGRYVLHRILTVGPAPAGHPERAEVIIQGDGVVKNTEKVTTADLYGKVITILRDGKTAVDPDSPKQLRRARRWRRIRCIRRPLLLAYRFAPWNYVWLRHQ